MPQILMMLLRLIAGVGGGAAAGVGAKKLGGVIANKFPDLAKAGAKKFGPTLGGRQLKTSLGGIAKGAAGFGGFIAGDVALGSLLGQGESGPPVPQEPGVEDIFRSLEESRQFGSGQAETMQRLFAETEVVNVLESLGIDPNDFLGAAQPVQRGIV